LLTKIEASTLFSLGGAGNYNDVGGRKEIQECVPEINLPAVDE
jgi:hypothetical protein